MGQNYQIPQQPQYVPPPPPPQYTPQPPTPPVQRRRPLWQWGCGALILLLVCGGIATALAPKPGPQQGNAVSSGATSTVAPATLAPATVAATSQPIAAATVAPTQAPPPTVAPPPTLAPPPTSTSAVVAVPPTGTGRAQASITVTSETSAIVAGGNASTAVKTTPNAKCSITYIVSEGASTAAGLQDKSANANGLVSWTWRISPSTGKGDHRVTITCNGVSTDANVTSNL